MWATPQAYFDKVAKEFSFTLDACATAENAKVAKYYSPEENSLVQDWSNEVIWMNPPYGRGIDAWIAKASDATTKGSTVVALLPARTDTRYFHRYIYQQPNVEIHFLAGRLKFGAAKNAAPFPSMLVIFKAQ